MEYNWCQNWIKISEGMKRTTLSSVVFRTFDCGEAWKNIYGVCCMHEKSYLKSDTVFKIFLIVGRGEVKQPLILFSLKPPLDLVFSNFRY